MGEQALIKLIPLYYTYIPYQLHSREKAAKSLEEKKKGRKERQAGRQAGKWCGINRPNFPHGSLNSLSSPPSYYS